MTNHGFDFSTINLPHEHLCLDFVNTTPNLQKISEDYVKSYADLVSWGLDVGLVTNDEAMQLWETASQQPAQAAELHQKAIVLRNAVYLILRAVAYNQTPNPADLNTLNRSLNEAMAHMRLLLSDGSFNWTWDDHPVSLGSIYWRAAWSASELLMSDQLQHVRQCEGCDWLFLDRGRGRKRRWCDMNTCGNRAKARRHYQRTKGQ